MPFSVRPAWGLIILFSCPTCKRAVRRRVVAQAQTRRASRMYPGIQSIIFYFASSLRSALRARQLSWSCCMEIHATKLSLLSPRTACHHAILNRIAPYEKYSDFMFVLLFFFFFSFWGICIPDFIFMIEVLVNATPRIMAYWSEWVDPIYNAAFLIKPNVLDKLALFASRRYEKKLLE